MRIRILILGVVIAIISGCTGQPTSAPDEHQQPTAQNEELADHVEEAASDSPEQHHAIEDSEVEHNESAGKLSDSENDGPANDRLDEQDAFLQQFFGTWIHQEQSDIRLEFQEGAESVGVEYGQMISKAEFTITEVNESEQYIVIEGTREMLSYDEESEKIPFSSKIYLQDNGDTLHYIFDYLESQVESIWVKS